MKLFESKIFDFLNYAIATVQNKLDVVRNNSFLLSNIDIFILLAVFATLIVSTFSSTEIIGVVAFVVPVLVVIKVLITKGEKIELEHWNFYLLIYLAICFISNFTSSMLPQSLYGFMKTLIYFAFYFAMCQFLKNNKKFIMPILLVISLLFVGESVIGILQNVIGVDNIATWQDTSYVNPEDVLSRVYGTLKPYNPNLFGGYLISGVASIMGFVAIFINRKKIKSASISLFALFWVMFTIFLTGCRGAYLALASILFFIVLFSYVIIFVEGHRQKLKKIWTSAFSLCSVGVIGFLAINHGILKRILSIFILRGDSSTSFRMNVYNSAIQMFQDNFLCGIGVGNKVFREIYGLYMLSGFDALSCYCVPLEIAVESGIFALLFFILFLVSLAYYAFKQLIQNKNFEYRVLLFVAIVSIFAVLIHGMFDTIFFRPQVQFVFWTMVAIATSLIRGTAQNNENS